MKKNEATNNKKNNKEKGSEKKSWMPHIFAVLFIIIIIATLASYVIPAGEYERVTMEDGREVIDPGTFEVVESTPVGIFDFMFAVPTGFIDRKSTRLNSSHVKISYAVC